MVTPLHPIGHAMAIGGVGVLGTEFERPRKAAQRAKDIAGNLHRSLHERREKRRHSRMSEQPSAKDITTATTTTMMMNDPVGQNGKESSAILDDTSSSSLAVEEHPGLVAPNTESRFARFLNRVNSR